MRLKIFLTALIIILLGLILVIQFYLKPRLPILTGYAAKMACSCSFIADRELASIEENDLNFFPVRLASTNVDLNGKTASAHFLGMQKKKAYYVEGRGCFLSDGDPTRAYLKFKKNPPSDTLSFAFHQLDQDSMYNVDQKALQHAIDFAFDKENDKKVKKTRAVVVIHRGNLVGEKYAPGIDKTTPLLGWSMTKSITNALIGIQVQKGLLDINQPAPIEDWKNDERKEITTDHLLNMESGLEWVEDYFSLSDVTRMLYMSDNATSVAVQKPLEFNPEKHWEYSSGTSNILSKVIRNKCSSYDEYLNLPYIELFHKIGMTSARMETDTDGNYIGSSYCFATARDWAKFGLLYLNDGVWNEKRILPEGWVDYTATPVPDSDGVYGAHFWLNHNHAAYPDAPADLFSANGFQGQRVYIIPSKDLVIVRMGLAGAASFDFNLFLKQICDVFPDTH